MDPVVDFVYVVIARFYNHTQFWREGVFDSEREAKEAWDRFAEGRVDVEFVRVLRINVTLSESIDFQ